MRASIADAARREIEDAVRQEIEAEERTAAVLGRASPLPPKVVIISTPSGLSGKTWNG
jgi:hypothetical protein